MAILDLFKRREPHTIYLEIEKKKVAYKIPTQFTTEEIERLLEIQIEIDKVKKEEVEEGSIDEVKLVNIFWDQIYNQLLVLFQHYQPETTLDYLKSHVSKESALEIIAFHTEQHVKNVEEDAKSSKKKVIKSS